MQGNFPNIGVAAADAAAAIKRVSDTLPYVHIHTYKHFNPVTNVYTYGDDHEHAYAKPYGDRFRHAHNRSSADTDADADNAE